MIVVRIIMNALPEKHLELTQTLLSLIEPTGKEGGCLSYAVFCDIEDKNRFSLLEEWETREDLNHHFRSHRFGVLLGSKTLLCESPTIQIDTVSLSEGMEAIHAARNKRINEITGKVDMNTDLEAKGKAEKRAGKIQEKIGKLVGK